MKNVLKVSGLLLLLSIIAGCQGMRDDMKESLGEGKRFMNQWEEFNKDWESGKTAPNVAPKNIESLPNNCARVSGKDNPRTLCWTPDKRCDEKQATRNVYIDGTIVPPSKADAKGGKDVGVGWCKYIVKE